MVSTNRPSCGFDGDETDDESLTRYEGTETTTGTVVLLTLFLVTGRAAAAHDSLPCQVPTDLTPLLNVPDTYDQQQGYNLA